MLRSQLHSPTSPVHRFSWQRTLCFQSQHILPLPREVSLSPGEEPIQRHRARTQSGPRHSHAAAPRNRAHGPPNTAHRGICAWNACERAIRNVAIRVCWVVRRQPIRAHIWGSMKGRTYSSGRISLRTTGEIERTTISIACDCTRDAAHPTGGSLRGSHRGKPRPPCLPASSVLLWAVAMRSTHNALLFADHLPPHLPFRQYGFTYMMGRGLGTHRAASSLLCFCTLDYSRANHGNWDRASARNELLDPCFKTGSWETHGFASDAPRMGFCAPQDTRSEKRKRALPLYRVFCHPPTSPVAFLCAGGRMGSTPLRAISGSAASETLFSRYAILQHG